jgi:hypothetical protein
MKTLSKVQISKIAEILAHCFDEAPEVKAARLLAVEGFSSENLRAFTKTKVGRLIPSYQVDNTINLLRRDENFLN